MKKRVISLLLALIMALSLLPVSVLAADDHTGQVHVTVENTTWAKADGAPWEGTLVEVDVYPPQKAPAAPAVSSRSLFACTWRRLSPEASPIKR